MLKGLIFHRSRNNRWRIGKLKARRVGQFYVMLTRRRVAYRDNIHELH